ncbi:DgyrCDS4180 [Dimorphilus gyrociliatus]|nr:DgyrCDS4180 [Dimorphilus gyrociliatus]
MAVLTKKTLFYQIIFILFLFVTTAFGRIHKITSKHSNDCKRTLTRFGFLKDGFLHVKFDLLPKYNMEGRMGFLLTRHLTSTKSGEIEQKMSCGTNETGGKSMCFSEKIPQQTNSSKLWFFEFHKKALRIDRYGNNFNDLYITTWNESKFEYNWRKFNMNTQELKNLSCSATPTAVKDGICNNSIPITDVELHPQVQFLIPINGKGEGYYGLYFCNARDISVNYTVYLIEKNSQGYLSASEIPLPTEFFVFSAIYFILSTFYLIYLKRSKEDVYKIHYCMTGLGYVKCIAILFHGLNYLIILRDGHQQLAFSVLYYITHLMKGIFLFGTIVFIGAGWTFIKFVLSNREKKVFLIVIPLQILNNFAYIMLEETDKVDDSSRMWKQISIFVDLLCCMAILFPVVWSIHHLTKAAKTDGKAIINLKKLKMFRKFYLLVICYIYFTRIIVYCLLVVPFRHEKWIFNLCRELGTFVFFIITAYTFRPTSNNPYLQVPDEEEEMQEV